MASELTKQNEEVARSRFDLRLRQRLCLPLLYAVSVMIASLPVKPAKVRAVAVMRLNATLVRKHSNAKKQSVWARFAPSVRSSFSRTLSGCRPHARRLLRPEGAYSRRPLVFVVWVWNHCSTGHSISNASTGQLVVKVVVRLLFERCRLERTSPYRSRKPTMELPTFTHR